MDRRKKRTSTNQYMMYIDKMEKDKIFATGRVPRNVDMNYLHELWKELARKLNTCSSGPKLTACEWRKRLNDWKNTTRCKYRRSLSSEEVSLTTLEMKALQLFGKTPIILPSDELALHLKPEKDEEMEEEDMDHQRTSEIFQKELQAAVEEAIGGDDDEEIMDEPEEQEEELLEPLKVDLKGEADISGAGSGTVDNTNTYRTIVVENALYTDGDENDDDTEFITNRRQASTSSSIASNAVSIKASAGVNTAPNTNVAKLINGDIPLKRLRSHAQEHIIYEVSSVKKAPPLPQPHPPPQQQQHQQQPSRILKTRHNSDAQQHYTESYNPTSSATITTSSLMGSSADGRDIARQLKRIADIKAEKLKFEVARFKFNNPGFVFNLQQI